MYLDIVILVVVVLSILDGLKDGLFVEFLSVFGLVINFLAAKKLTPIIMEFLKLHTQNNYFVTYIVIFWAVYIIIGILLHFIRNIMDSQSKGFILRFLGGIIGLIKGFILGMLIVFIFNFSTDIFPDIAKYGKDSRSGEIFLKTIPIVEKHIPKIFKEKIDKIKNEKIVDRYINKLF